MLSCFYIRPSAFFSLFKVRWHVIVCINHEIVISLCFKILKSLSYYNHPGYGKKFLVSYGDRTWVLSNVSHLLYPWTRELTLKSDGCTLKNIFLVFQVDTSCKNVDKWRIRLSAASLTLAKAILPIVCPAYLSVRLSVCSFVCLSTI